MNFHHFEEEYRSLNFRDMESAMERRGFTSETENRATNNAIKRNSDEWNLLNHGSKNHSYNRNKDSVRENSDARRRTSSSTSIPYYSSNSGMYHALDYRNIGIRLENDVTPKESNTSREPNISDESKSLQSSTNRRSEPILIPRKVEVEEQEIMSRNSSKELERYFESKADRMNERRRRSNSNLQNASWDPPVNPQQSVSLNSPTASYLNAFFLDHGVLTLEDYYE